MMASFAQLPSSASTSIQPFTIHFSNSELKRLQDLLKLTEVIPVSYENSLPESERHLGLRRDWLATAKQYWENEFDWRMAENRMNSFPHYMVPVNDEQGTFDIHFVALFSKKQDAIPLLMLHGWPGSFLEFLEILSLLQKQHTPDTLPYHVIIPSLPGYTFSKLPPQKDFSQVDCGRVFNTLATKVLGFESYVVQGGDVGSRVARVMGAEYDACKAVHLNFCPMSPPTDLKTRDAISEMEKQGLKRAEEWKATGQAYAIEHATKPATIGIMLESNPIALLAWIGEKFLEWTDKDPSIQTIVESVTLYFLTRCAHTNLWSYRHAFGPNAKPHDRPEWYIRKPLGYSYFPMEVIPTPITWVATTGNLVHSKVHNSGGHFAALEEPKKLWEDIHEFITKAWKQ